MAGQNLFFNVSTECVAPWFTPVIDGSGAGLSRAHTMRAPVFELQGDRSCAVRSPF
jgi:hypothetical protein